ncbi:SCP2 sterol-binding domain-containing protein [Marinobacter sp. M3C]|uniref:ubiquinone anaerobic biosynthesis accessory factor UbiT n=1 Tax=Marinobacter sp. M3C TaxID=2917715 RepID=UPI00200F6A0A|nr:SCP2 sterol-binding domain-containing protein [Marinobacter sp. M3C]UQG59485.1 SCP2 sterol-binding domain-containing protein [Marinobacter sp. M3C]
MALHMPTFLPRPSLSAFHTLPGISRVQAASQELVANPLMTDSLALLNEYLPSPSQLLAAIDHRIPLVLKQLIIEAPLNGLFAEAIADGEFDDFEGHRIRLELNGGQPGVTFGFWAGRLRIVNGPGEATIRGSLSAFKTLAERNQDPDQLFFQRRLVIEGDTELGLALKNLLDSLEWSIGVSG